VLALANVCAFARIAIILLLIISFLLQGYLMRGLPAASLKGG
jgi:ABC-type glycerol-3-phosphate transport system permease component